jgi:hypothetical protein
MVRLTSGREQWMLNTNVALLLGEKDLQLSRCKLQYLHFFEVILTVCEDTAWERIPLTLEAKKLIWRTQNGWYTLREPNLAAFRKQFYDGSASVDELVAANKSLFCALDLFFVKVC